jgi:hypothetical protein
LKKGVSTMNKKGITRASRRSQNILTSILYLSLLVLTNTATSQPIEKGGRFGGAGDFVFTTTATAATRPVGGLDVWFYDDPTTQCSGFDVALAAGGVTTLTLQSNSTYHITKGWIENKCEHYYGTNCSNSTLNGVRFTIRDTNGTSYLWVGTGTEQSPCYTNLATNPVTTSTGSQSLTLQ